MGLGRLREEEERGKLAHKTHYLYPVIGVEERKVPRDENKRIPKKTPC